MISAKEAFKATNRNSGIKRLSKIIEAKISDAINNSNFSIKMRFDKNIDKETYTLIFDELINLGYKVEIDSDDFEISWSEVDF